MSPPWGEVRSDFPGCPLWYSMCATFFVGWYVQRRSVPAFCLRKGGVLKLFFSLFSFIEDLMSLCWCKFGYRKSIRKPLLTVCPLQLFPQRGQLLGVAWPSFGSGSCSAAVSWTEAEPLPRLLQIRSSCSHGALHVGHPGRLSCPSSAGGAWTKS